MSEPEDLRGPILLAALALLALDALVIFLLSGGMRQLLRRRRAVATALAIGILGSALLGPPHAFAQSNDDQALKATLETRLAYVITGDAEVDRISKAGLQGLTLFLAQRTALEAGEPVGLDPARDELAFYPLIYWPIVPSAPKPTREALEHIDAYMKQGGTVLFDTRDAVEAPPGAGGDTRGPGMQALRAILSSLDIPELEPVRRDHVLTKTFYLLKDFPGRFSSGQLWVEALTAADEDEPASGRPGHAADLGRRGAPARVRVPRRRQHCDVHAHRQLQGRPGPRSGVAGTAGTIMGASSFETRLSGARQMRRNVDPHGEERCAATHLEPWGRDDDD